MKWNFKWLLAIITAEEALESIVIIIFIIITIIVFIIIDIFIIILHNIILARCLSTLSSKKYLCVWENYRW